jgi:hypothetical protein
VHQATSDRLRYDVSDAFLGRLAASRNLEQFVEAQKREKQRRDVTATQTESSSNPLKYYRVLHYLVNYIFYPKNQWLGGVFTVHEC